MTRTWLAFVLRKRLTKNLLVADIAAFTTALLSALQSHLVVGE
jgi:hypothetical protein